MLRVWGLDRNGLGTEYYAAAVRSMLGGWHNFLYASFDPAGFVSVDKPPVALWIQVASAKLFGFHGLALLAPEVVEGVAAVALLYVLVRRHFGVAAGLLAALFLAITPVSVAIVMTPLATHAARGVAAGALAAGLVALLIAPAAWALSSVLSAGNLMLPSANVNRLVVAESIAAARDRGRAEAAVRSEKLVGFLRANRSGERFLLGMPSAPLAAPIIVRTGEPVMAMGGFHGEDPILTPEALGRLIMARQIRFVLVGDEGGFGWRPGGETANLAVAEWIRANGTIVDPALWRADGAGGAAGRGRLRMAGMQLYDLRPSAGLVTPSPQAAAPTP